MVISQPMENIDLIKEQQGFLKTLEIKGKSFNTIKNYRTDLNIFNQYLVKNKRDLILSEITSEQVRDYSRFLEEKYSSPNSIRRRVQALRIFFDWLIENGKHNENPIKKALVSPKVVDIPRPISFKNVIKIFAYLEGKIETSDGLERLIHMRNKLLFYLIYGAGLKVSDLETLMSSSIFPGDPSRVMVAHPKRDPYTITLPPKFERFYWQYMEELESRKQTDQIDFDNLLFNANPYKILKGGLSARGIEVIFKDISKKLDFSVTAKNLRQSCIFKWMNQKRKDSQIKEWMGVQPAYSLKPYKSLLEEMPDQFTYQEMEESES